MGMSSPCVNCGADAKVCKECDWYNGKWISKDQYETRLKADMIAMLTEIQSKIEKKSYYDTTIIGNYEDEVRIDLVELDDVNEVIQQKINSLKEAKDGENNY
jgi:predicted molibdopterin-dependent oxidoreductase YjgC